MEQKTIEFSQFCSQLADSIFIMDVGFVGCKKKNWQALVGIYVQFPAISIKIANRFSLANRLIGG